MKKWLFSIFCYVAALIVTLFAVLGYWILEEETYIYVILMVNALSPTLILIIIGIVNSPRKEKK